MISYAIFVFAVAFQVISAQGPAPPPLPPNLPPQCRGPPQGVGKPHECCKVPPFFADDDFAGCGFQKLTPEGGPGPVGPPDCSKQLCLLKKYNLLKDDTNVNHEAVNAFLDKWAATHTHFQSVIATAKDRCVGKTLPGPPQICDADKMVFCVSSTLFEFCPAWEETQECKALKSHLDECKPYFRQ